MTYGPIVRIRNPFGGRALAATIRRMMGGTYRDFMITAAMHQQVEDYQSRKERAIRAWSDVAKRSRKASQWAALTLEFKRKEKLLMIREADHADT